MEQVSRSEIINAIEVLQDYRVFLKNIAPELVEQKITNMSINSSYKTYLNILGQTHWFNSLRVCEQIIFRNTELLENEYNKVHRHENKDIPNSALIRDTLEELKIAVSLKEKILAEHPEINDMSFEEIQFTLGKDAHVSDLSHKIACQVMAKETNLPYDILELLSRFPHDDCLAILEQTNFNLRTLKSQFQFPFELANNLNYVTNNLETQPESDFRLES